MNTTVKAAKPQRSTGALLIEFLGSMNLAITLLVVISIASIIGTVLQQNEPYQNYIMKFGPFWFEVFKVLGLYDIYSTPWFVVLLAFLLVSTSVCVYRNAPGILRDMRHFRLDAQVKSLSAFKCNVTWQSESAPSSVLENAGKYLQNQGYRVRVKRLDGGQRLAAMKGASSRLGYLLSHVAIVVICIGGLIDGNLPLKIAESMGKIAIETRDIPVTEVPEKSKLPPDNMAFRGSVSLPEGSRANFIFLGMRDGYLVQSLPFSVELKDFRIEHYPSGMPKSFESDLVIHDDELDAPLERTIAVNHPLVYKGYAIYQSSFSDGGSLVKLASWPLFGTENSAITLDGSIKDNIRLFTAQGPFTLELDDFKKFNIFPADENDPVGKKFNNYGPSVVFKLRAASGEAREYVNYLSPVVVDGRPFFLSGMRTSVNEDYRFLHIPVDPKGGIERFMRYRALAHDQDLNREVALAQLSETSLMASMDEAARANIIDNMVRLVQLFLNQGIDAVVAEAEANAGAEKRDEALQSYIQVIQGILGGIYVELLLQEGVDVEQGVTEQDSQFFDDAINALSLIGHYGSPVYLQLKSFEHIEASGLQITKAPGQNIVYLGCVMLMVGVFFMFYLHHRRLWLHIRDNGEGSEILFAGTGHRDRADFENEFATLCSGLEAVTGKDTSRSSNSE